MSESSPRLFFGLCLCSAVCLALCISSTHDMILKREGSTGGNSSDMALFVKGVSLFFAIRLHVVVTVWCALNAIVFVAYAIARVMFGRLSDHEHKELRENVLNYLLFRVVFMGGVLPSTDLSEILIWSIWFVLFGGLRVLVLLARERFVALTTEQPNVDPPPRSAFVSVIVLVACVGLLNVIIAGTVLFWLFPPEQAGWSVVCMLLFESVVLQFGCIKVIGKYIVHLISLSRDGTWEDRGHYIYYIEFCMESVILATTFLHHCHIWLASGISFSLLDLFLLMNIRTTGTSLWQRIASYRHYVRALQALDSRYEDATPDELRRVNDNCAICRDRMDAAKRLPCGHLFHRSCLQQSIKYARICPICRYDLLLPPNEQHARFRQQQNAPPTPHAAAGAAAGGGGAATSAVPQSAASTTTTTNSSSAAAAPASTTGAASTAFAAVRRPNSGSNSAAAAAPPSGSTSAAAPAPTPATAGAGLASTTRERPPPALVRGFSDAPYDIDPNDPDGAPARPPTIDSHPPPPPAAGGDGDANNNTAAATAPAASANGGASSAAPPPPARVVGDGSGDVPALRAANIGVGVDGAAAAGAGGGDVLGFRGERLFRFNTANWWPNWLPALPLPNFSFEVVRSVGPAVHLPHHPHRPNAAAAGAGGGGSGTAPVATVAAADGGAAAAGAAAAGMDPSALFEFAGAVDGMDGGDADADINRAIAASFETMQQAAAATANRSAPPTATTTTAAVPIATAAAAPSSGATTAPADRRQLMFEAAQRRLQSSSANTATTTPASTATASSSPYTDIY